MNLTRLQLYQAPEVCSGIYEPAPVDLWALGAVLLELLLAKTLDTIELVEPVALGQLPGLDKLEEQLHRFRQRCLARGYSETLVNLLPKLLQKDPCQRIQIPALLQEILQSFSVISPPITQDLDSLITLRQQVLNVAQAFHDDKILEHVSKKPTIAVVLILPIPV